MKEVNLVPTEIKFYKFSGESATYNSKDDEDVAYLFLREDENRAYVILSDGLNISFPLDRCVVKYKEVRT